ncbi:MAG TPA: DUF63 family protein [archaeon]|nr:DUF63 family protein [archaeon]
MPQDFVFEYFCKPMITQGVQGYNLVNTATYAIILFLLAAYVVFPLLKKIGVKPGFRFMLALLPFVLFGSTFRVLNDMGFFAKTCSPLELGFYTFTPGIWLLTAAITIAALLVAKKIAGENERRFYNYFTAIGMVFAIPVIIYEFTVFKAWSGFLISLGIATAVTFGAKFLAELKWKEMFKDKLNILVLAGQAMDGSATFVATNLYRCGEQHPLSEAILGVNPALFILVKAVIAILIIYSVDSEIQDENTRSFIKVAVAILGFAPGLRDLFTVGVGTCL